MNDTNDPLAVILFFLFPIAFFIVIAYIVFIENYNQPEEKARVIESASPVPYTIGGENI